jgi:hypothetical protein
MRKPIPNAPNYWATDKGHILSTHSGRLRRLKPCRTQSRLHVAICVGESEKRIPIARLVCLAFHGEPPPGKSLAIHRSRHWRDNRPENVFWGDASDLARLKAENGVMARGVRHHAAKLSPEKAAAIRKLREQGHLLRRIGQRFGVARPTVGEVVRGVRWLPEPPEKNIEGKSFPPGHQFTFDFGIRDARRPHRLKGQHACLPQFPPPVPPSPTNPAPSKAG